MSVFIVKDSFTFEFTTIIRDTADAPIILAQMTTLTLTYYDVRTAIILNGRLNQNVLNANDCTYHATSGLLTWVGQPADVAVLDSTVPYGAHERHRALFRWTWDTPTRFGGTEIDFWVQNLQFVPT